MATTSYSTDIKQPNRGYPLAPEQFLSRTSEDRDDLESIYPPSYITCESDVPSYVTHEGRDVGPAQDHAQPLDNGMNIASSSRQGNRNHGSSFSVLQRNPQVVEKERRTRENEAQLRVDELQKPSLDPKEAKKIQERQQRELEKQKREEFARSQQERARQVMRKRLNLPSGEMDAINWGYPYASSKALPHEYGALKKKEDKVKVSRKNSGKGVGEGNRIF